MRSLLTICLLVLAHPIWSAPIVVKSGEHPDFTRLVVYLQPDQSWEITEEGGFSSLSISGWTQGFEIGSVFDKINTQRLKTISASDDSLVMSLGCDCEISATTLEQGYLSLDIRDGERPRPAPRPETSDNSAVDTEQAEKAVAKVSRPELDWPVVFEDAPDAGPLAQVIERNLTIPSREFEGELGAEIARSATLTYLDPSGAVLQRKGSREPDNTERSQAELLRVLGERAKFVNAQEAATAQAAKPKPSCPVNSEVAVSSWGGDLPFADELAALRGGLYSEFDELDEKAVRRLAKFYIHYAMAPEFIQLRDRFEGPVSRIQYQDLASILSGEQGVRSEDPQFPGCEGEAGFWALVMYDFSLELEQSDIAKYVATFQRIPRHLQELTADRLVEVFDKHGFETASDVIRNTLKISFGGDDESNATPTLDADLPDAGQEDLLKLVEENTEKSPEALAVYLEHANENNEPISNELLELTGAYIHQLEGSETANRLRSAEILASAIRGNLEQAFDGLFTASEDKLYEPDHLRAEVLNIALSGGGISNVSELIWKFLSRGFLPGLPVELINQTAKYLTENGQPQLALLILEEMDIQTASPGYVIDALGQSDRASEAMQLIEESVDTDLSSFSSTALIASDPSAAWRLRDRLHENLADQAAWLTKNWNAVAGETARAKTSQLILQSEVSSDDEQDKPIKTARNAQNESREARKILNELLN